MALFTVSTVSKVPSPNSGQEMWLASVFREPRVTLLAENVCQLRTIKVGCAEMATLLKLHTRLKCPSLQDVLVCSCIPTAIKAKPE